MTLISAMRSEFGKSKKHYNQSLLINLILMVLSMIAIFIVVGKFAVFVGVGLLVFPILSFISREISMVHQNRAEKIRRLLVLVDGLNYKPSDLEVAQLEVDLGKIDRSEPTFTEPYYNSTLQQGANRLADIIAESSFFTKNLTKKATLVFFISILLVIILIIVILYVLLPFGVSKTIGEMIAKWVALIMVFFIAGDFAFLWRRYYLLSCACDHILSESNVLRKKSDVSIVEVMQIADEYNCAVIQAPPIPGIIYKCMQKSLNKAWRNKELKE